MLGNEIVRVKIWSADGRILYSDEPRLSARYLLREEEQEVMVSGDPKLATQNFYANLLCTKGVASAA